MESLRHAIERCAQTGGERERTLASTIFSHNGGVSCRENYDTVSSMQKKKKKERGKNKNKKKKTGTAYVSDAALFRFSRFTRFPRETNCGVYPRNEYEKKKERGSSMITDDAKEERGGRKGRVAKS